MSGAWKRYVIRRRWMAGRVPSRTAGSVRFENVCSRTAVNDRPSLTHVRPRDRLGARASDRGRVHERQVGLVQEVVDQDRRVGLHPSAPGSRPTAMSFAAPEARQEASSGRGARGGFGASHTRPSRSVTSAGRDKRGPVRDRGRLLQGRDQHAGALGGEPPAVVRAVQCGLRAYALRPHCRCLPRQCAVADEPGRQPRPPVRARVDERPDGSASNRARAQPCPASRTATGSSPTSLARATGCQNSESAG